MSYPHTPVMRREALDFLNLKPGMRVLDATVGCGGHAEGILERIGGKGVLIGVDWDGEALVAARPRLALAGRDVRLRRRNFREIGEILAEEGIERIDAALFDLGMSSLQLDSAERGFSFAAHAPLDMRMDRRRGVTAAALIARCASGELERYLREYGEEPLSGPIARGMAKRRPADTAALADLVRGVYRRLGKKKGRIDPATRVFQALRIAVNEELDNLKTALPQVVDLLETNGRLAVISFHSLEDRIVKNVFKRYARGCTCPPGFPVCRCGKSPVLRIVTGRPVGPSPGETKENPRARSARLRVAEKL